MTIGKSLGAVPPVPLFPCSPAKRDVPHCLADNQSLTLLLTGFNRFLVEDRNRPGAPGLAHIGIENRVGLGGGALSAAVNVPGWQCVGCW